MKKSNYGFSTSETNYDTARRTHGTDYVIGQRMEDYETAICDNKRILEYLASDFGIKDGEQVDSRKREIERLNLFLV